MIRCALYIRVSSDEQAKLGDSIRDQKERGLDYINKRSDTLLQDTYLDDGISGQKLDRGEFTRLMDAVRSGEIDLIIFTKLDRWFRSLRHYLNTQAILEEYNVAWIAIDQPFFDTSTPYGRAFVAQSMTWAELEAQNDGLRIKDVLNNKVKNGEVITGKVPRGYKIENKHLVLSEEAPAIQDCIQHFLQTNNMYQSVKYMRNKYNIIMSVANFKKSILMNEKYIGKCRDNLEYCPRLITNEEFQEIQRLLSTKMNVKSSQRYDYIFSGLLVCDECGYKITSTHINVKSVRKSGKVYRYKYPAYECKQAHRDKRCPNGGAIRESRIEEYLLENIRNEMNNYVVKVESKQAKMIDNKAIRSSVNKKMDRLKALYLDEIISLDEYKLDREKLEKELQDLPEIAQSTNDMRPLKDFIEGDFESIYKQLDNKSKRKFWRGFIKEIKVSKSVNRSRKFTIIFL